MYPRFAASAAMGPGVAAQLARRWPHFATAVVAATILVLQTIVAASLPWIGGAAEVSGRRPFLLGGCFRSKACCMRPCPARLRWC
jgi:hypothetical protein